VYVIKVCLRVDFLFYYLKIILCFFGEVIADVCFENCIWSESDHVFFFYY